MARPRLLGAGITDFDTQRAYTKSGPDVGSVAVLNGRSYVWCSHTASATLVRGEALIRDDLQTIENLSITTAGLAVGRSRVTDITAHAAAISANEFAEGYLVVVDGGGEGTIYRIREHTAFTASSADGTIHLYDPIVVASDAATEITLIKNKFANPRQSKTLGKDSFIGVPNVTVPDGSTDTQYFWAQRNGICPVFIQGTPDKGTPVVVSNGRDGHLTGAKETVGVSAARGGGGRRVETLDESPVVGQMTTRGVDGEVGIVDLQNPLF